MLDFYFFLSHLAVVSEILVVLGILERNVELSSQNQTALNSKVLVKYLGRSGCLCYSEPFFFFCDLNLTVECVLNMKRKFMLFEIGVFLWKKENQIC